MSTATDFKQHFATLKSEIDGALQAHTKRLSNDTARNFTPYSVVAVDAYVQVLERGGKRIRGALTIVGYEMCGGKNREMIVQAAAAIEMVHAYILVLDDIMDKSVMRRGGPSAHTLVAKYHVAKGLSGESNHFGEAIAINAALIGYHYAEGLVANLDADSDDKLRAMHLLNDALMVTGHGQVNDLFNEVLDSVDERAVDNVLEWKTAHYSFLNPLQFGMALAGADKESLAAITEYCMHAGRAFQITDDILGTFGSELEAGKSPMDDIREGKRTLLSIAAIRRADSGDKNFLIQMFGNERLTHTEFARCKEIFVATGALEIAQHEAVKHIAKAKESLQKNAGMWSDGGSEFLSALVSQMLGRSA
jgi:geranylgeranyl diphosphate synthase, type I